MCIRDSIYASAIGANVNIRDKFGNTPLDVTLNNNIAGLLRKHGGKTGQELKAESN